VTNSLILLGEVALWVALLMAAWSATVSFAGAAQGRRDLTLSGERAVYATFGFVALASVGLWTALFAHDFSIKFVASYTSANLPKVYTFTAFWAGQSGSLLFWCLILSMYSALAVFFARGERLAVFRPYVAGTLGVTTLFFLLTLCFGANPFERLDWTPPDGRGMNPQLQNPGWPSTRPCSTWATWPPRCRSPTRSPPSPPAGSTPTGWPRFGGGRS
jgi:cytochrome c-type biogenesis protein CcmF